ncbi:sigma-70 family RNA polymerase sigma factor [Lentzea tibetensis]|uniref:Sigma-70 family RNA polymerase sigma factor n=1 Tax=Lentzea tibetensis TaxID=2591470 RepID=A0A563EY21_9PSEU|nr:sigma-70 family RNA polymerase sigma factor [Lentzea tibetensis]TWP52381.1 sigma-70 family RNA polymerase sigma factor [Lentzea tibetensis]
MATVSEVETLVRGHLSLVEREVRRLGRRLPPHVERDDLVSAGLLALVGCARGYQGRGLFARVACVRVRGALLDHLRDLDWASRSVRARARQLQVAEDDLVAVLGRTPTAAELAEALGVTAREVSARVQDVLRADTFSLQGVAPEITDLLVRERAPGPEDLLLRREEIGYLRDAVEALPERLRTVVVRYFVQGCSMVEIAAELGVGESRVSHMRAEALALLRDGLNAQLDRDLVAEAPSDHVARKREAYFAAIAGRGTLRSRLAA